MFLLVHRYFKQHYSNVGNTIDKSRKKFRCVAIQFFVQNPLISMKGYFSLNSLHYAEFQNRFRTNIIYLRKDYSKVRYFTRIAFHSQIHGKGHRFPSLPQMLSPDYIYVHMYVYIYHGKHSDEPYNETERIFLLFLMILEKAAGNA